MRAALRRVGSAGGEVEAWRARVRRNDVTITERVEVVL